MIIVIGSFDGFHSGHQILFRAAARMAEEVGTNWNVLTFSPHPQLLFPGPDKRLLFTEEERQCISSYLSIPGIIKIHFSKKVSGMRPEEFIEFLDDNFDIEGVVVGNNFRFGRNREGSVTYLAFIASEKGWMFSAIDIFKKDGTNVSSTMIRGLVSCGLMKDATKLLGYPFFIRGRVERGDRRGRGLGYPTVNISVPVFKVIPPDGVYAGSVSFEGMSYPAAVNIGFNPTFFDISSIRIEAHLVGFKGDLYGKVINVFFWEKLRGEIRFSNTEELKRQIGYDVEEASALSKRYSEEMDISGLI